MSRKRNKKMKILDPKFKVKLDSRTIITVKDLSALDFWRTKYPNLQIIKE